MIVSTIDACGGPAKLLGVEFDNKLAQVREESGLENQIVASSSPFLFDTRFGHVV